MITIFKSICQATVLAAFLLNAIPASSTIPDRPKSGAPVAPVFTDAERQTELAKRRAAVLAEMKDNSAMVLWSAEPKIYANDVDYYYRQENNLNYLTALKQQNAALMIYKKGAEAREVLFIPKRNPQRETWNGRMYSNEDATRLSGIKAIVDAAESTAMLDALKKKEEFVSKNGISIPGGFSNFYILLPRSTRDTNGAREFAQEASFAKTLTGYSIENAQPVFAKLRQIKSDYELKILQHAVDISGEAHMRAMSTIGLLKWEYETQAEIEYIFRKRNADYWGYPSIVGCGPNGTTLHYIESQSPVSSGQLMLIDVGAEYDHYTADVTRTFPVNGRFTPAQRDIYQIVYDAQEAAAARLKPGAMVSEAAGAATALIEERLAKLGLITGVGATIPGSEMDVPDGKGGMRKTATPQYRLWFMHGWGHWLGMNVHDVGLQIPLAPGMVTTNEPGVYIRGDALDYMDMSKPEVKAFVDKIRPAFERYKNIGVRIEDDMLITPTGVAWMSGGIPRKLEEIEGFMARKKR